MNYFLRLGLDSLLGEVMQEDENEDVNNQDDGSSKNNENLDSNSDSDDYEKKSDTAEDFSDITELAEDIQVTMQPERSTSKHGDDYDDIEAAIPASTVKIDASQRNDAARADSDEPKRNDNDKELMPPPSAPPKLTLK